MGDTSTKSRKSLTKWSLAHYLSNVFKTYVAIHLIMLSLLTVVLSRRENNFDIILFNFSELLALEITKSNDVQVCQFTLIRWNPICFFPWPYHFYIHNSFDVWLFFYENVNVTYGGKNNLEINKVVKKVNQSNLKIVEGELKQYQEKWK